MEGDYYKTEESVAEYIEMAKDVNGKRVISELQKELPENTTLLELGSGPGTDWNLLNELYNVVGSDNSKEFIKHLKLKNPEGTFIELDAVSLKTNLKFNGIYSNKVMHHLQDDEFVTSIKKQSEILEDNGIICHSFWKGDGSEIFKGMFINYHNEIALKQSFEKDFEIISIQEYQEFEPDDSILLVAKKK